MCTRAHRCGVKWIGICMPKWLFQLCCNSLSLHRALLLITLQSDYEQVLVQSRVLASISHACFYLGCFFCLGCLLLYSVSFYVGSLLLSRMRASILGSSGLGACFYLLLSPTRACEACFYLKGFLPFSGICLYLGRLLVSRCLLPSLVLAFTCFTCFFLGWSLLSLWCMPQPKE